MAFYESSLTNVGKALIIGLLLLAMLLGFFTGWRAAVICSVSILLSLPVSS